MRWALLAAAVAALLAPASAHAATFTVNTPTDPPRTPCTTELCSLRAALIAAQSNGAAEEDTIIVPSGTYNVTSALELDGQFNTRITIAGAGANRTIVRPADGGQVLIASQGSQATVRDVTLRDGSAGIGANVLVESSARLALVGVRVTSGNAARGAGIATTGATSLDISRSLIDSNFATAASSTADLGGGIYVEGQTTATRVTIEDSTITANRAQIGGGIAVTNNTGQPPALRGVTLARNVATTGIGGISSPQAGARIQGSIIAGNVVTIVLGQGTQTFPANCGAAYTDEGGNVESEADCGLAGHQNTDPQLASALDFSAQPPVLTIPATSPAVDIAACGTRTADQRGVARPQGVACDAGAYEFQPPPPAATPTPEPTVSPTPTPSASPTPAPPPTPEFHKTVVVRKVSGRVRVRRPGSRDFVDLDATQGIPLGSIVDTKRGVVELASVPKPGGAVERAQFFDGIFRVTQPGSITDLRLVEQLAPCSKRARAAAKKPKTRKLWGAGSGSFRTTGNYSAATVRGTKWLVQDSCSSTLTRVTQGVVAVRDKVRKRTILLRAGRRYVAKPRR